MAKEYKKPQSPLEQRGTYIYPLTTDDQVILADGRRLGNENGLNINADDVDALSIDITDVDQGTATGIDADTLGGNVASDYVLEIELDAYKNEISSGLNDLETIIENNATNIATLETNLSNDITTLENSVATNYLLKTEIAADSHLFGGKAPIYYIQPRNLLDNSDFRNPVNQRGVTSSTGSYGIDRWLGFYTIKSGCVQLTGGFTQYILEDNVTDGRTYTAAVLLENGTIYIGSGTLTKSATDWQINKWHGDLFMGVMYESDKGAYKYYLTTANGATFNVVWAALYEGAYTVDTLPPYIPKGYGAELIECQRYYWQAKDMFRIRCNQCTGTVIDFLINFPVPMRTEPQLILPSEAYIYTLNGTANSGFTLSSPTIAEAAISGYMMLRATKSSHGLTDGWIGIPTGTGFSADL